VVQVTSLEVRGLYLCLYLVVPIELKEFVVNWFRRGAFSSHVGQWLGLALAILVLFALRIALSRLVFWFLKRKRDTDESEDESEREYWRIHGG
jgi:hypothetical protein